MQNIAVRFFLCSGVVLSALYLIWPAHEVRAGRVSDAIVTAPAPQTAPVATGAAQAPSLTKVSAASAAVPMTTSIRN